MTLIQNFYGLNVGQLDQNMWDYRTALPDTFKAARDMTEPGYDLT